MRQKHFGNHRYAARRKGLRRSAEKQCKRQFGRVRPMVWSGGVLYFADDASVVPGVQHCPEGLARQVPKPTNWTPPVLWTPPVSNAASVSSPPPRNEYYREDYRLRSRLW